MVLKKQTVWLLTMLTLMVVLSAYYLFNHQPTDMNDFADGNELADMEQDNFLNTLGDVNSDMDMSVESMTDDDYFLSYRMEREATRAEMIEHYSEIISSDATAQAIAEAVGKQNEIWERAEAEMTLEELLKTEGYEEAVVVADADRVNVVVKSDTLDRRQVLNIIHLVRNHLPHVNGNQVIVSAQ
jgi:stage III sporulation protein AH